MSAEDPLGDVAAAERLPELQRAQLRRMLELLDTDGHAPTSVREAGEAARVHIADSLAALELDLVHEAERIVDIGSGAGFPGLALAVALPDAAVVVIDSQRRKCDFLERVCVAAGIANADVVCVRAEEWSAGASRHDVALARAIAEQPVVLEYAAPLLRLGGSLVDWRGRRAPAEERAAERAADVLGLEHRETRRVVPFDGATDRHLHVYLKVSPTPPRFPRRAGVARRRPLGAPKNSQG
jgi:16S rRNA (guanine527-N7)-methyltransferase